MSTSEPALNQNKRIMRAAVVIALGNIISRVLGLAREVVKANLFGASGLLSAFTVATLVPMTIYQLIMGGEMVTSSLVPVFSEYTAPQATAEETAARRAELGRVFSTFLSLITILLLLFVGLVELFAPQVAWLVGARNFSDPALFDITVDLMRLSTPAVLFLSASSIVSAMLYALQRFTLPAFTVATFNGAIVLVALLRPGQIDSLVWGLLLGAFLQVALQLPGLREANLRWHFEWWHPAIKRIAFLYAPIVGGLLLNQAVIWVSYNLATQTGDSSVTYMTYATTLYQFPLGLVVMGLSTATLPMLSQQAQGQLGLFRQTLVQGLRLVMILILPATLGLLALAEPIVRLLFEHGQFLPADTHMTTLVLRVYLIGLPFAAVDQMLVYASYARQDTWRPALAGAVSILVYLVVAVVLLRPLGLLSLMAADAVKHIVHTAIMVWILTHQLEHWEGLELPSVLGKGVVSAGLTSLSAYLTYLLLLPYLPPVYFLNHLLLVVLPGVSALVVYALLVKYLNISEAKMLPTLFKRG